MRRDGGKRRKEARKRGSKGESRIENRQKAARDKGWEIFNVIGSSISST